MNKTYKRAHFDQRCFVVMNLAETQWINAGLNLKSLRKKYPLNKIINGSEANLKMGLNADGSEKP